MKSEGPGQRQRNQWSMRTCLGGVGVFSVIVLLGGLLVWSPLRNSMVGMKQRRAIYALRSWGGAVQAFAIETGSLPPSSGSVDEVLLPYLHPTYYRGTEVTDYWSHPLHYEVSPDGSQYRIVSRGWKGSADLPPGWLELEPKATSCWEDDTVLEMPKPRLGQPSSELGELVRYPDGPQRPCTLGGWAAFWTIP